MRNTILDTGEDKWFKEYGTYLSIYDNGDVEIYSSHDPDESCYINNLSDEDLKLLYDHVVKQLTERKLNF